MDSTGENWKIQVPDYTAQMLISKGYTCVVSWAIMTTYNFLLTPFEPNSVQTSEFNL